MATPALKRITQIITHYNQAHSDAAHDQASRIYSEYIGPLQTENATLKSENARLGRLVEKLKKENGTVRELLVQRTNQIAQGNPL